MNFLEKLLGKSRTVRSSQRTRLVEDHEPAAIFAIGDIHGRFDLMQSMEDQVFELGKGIEGDKWLITLGDHVDRGQSSNLVLSHLLKPIPEGWRRIALCGNHEVEMLAFLREPGLDRFWLDLGGAETLGSYGISLDLINDPRTPPRRWREAIEAYVPAEHIELLENLPVLLETPHCAFVHAGGKPGSDLASLSDDELTTFRDSFRSDFSSFPRTIVHGHQIRREPIVEPKRLALDTGAFATGVLSAALITPNKPPSILRTVGKYL